MSSIWHTLGLDGPTDDVKAIKRAYSRKLRVTRPDDDPDGFMALREAFEIAKSQAAYYAPTVPDVPDDVAPERVEDIGEEPEYDTDDFASVVPAKSIIEEQERAEEEAARRIQEEREAQEREARRREEAARARQEQQVRQAELNAEMDRAQEFLKRAQKYLKSDKRRNDDDKWEDLVEDAQDALSLDAYNYFEENLRDVILEHFGYYEDDAHDPKAIKRREKKPPKNRMRRKAARELFMELGWNRWKGRPPHVQRELLWLFYETGIKQRPVTRPENYDKQTASSSYIRWTKYMIATVIAWVVFAIQVGPSGPDPTTREPGLIESVFALILMLLTLYTAFLTVSLVGALIWLAIKGFFSGIGRFIKNILD